MPGILHLSAVQIAEAIQKGAVSSTSVVRAHIAQIEKVNPHVNALVADRFTRALEEAHKADEMLVHGKDIPPFHGVPCTIKECFAVMGMPQSSGLVARKRFVASEDAVSVSRLRQAGFIPLGVSNLSELCMWMESNNKVYGRTNNPYDLTRTAGGSSGGEGAIVGFGGAPIGLGSDIGGSIRMPAFFNGVFGHKPSPGIISNVGQYPIAENEAVQYLCTGPLCRRAEDLMAITKILAGDQAHRIREEAVELDSLRVFNIVDDGRISVSSELQSVQHQVAHYLAQQGAEVIELRLEGLRQSVEIWSALLEQAN